MTPPETRGRLSGRTARIALVAGLIAIILLPVLVWAFSPGSDAGSGNEPAETEVGSGSPPIPSPPAPASAAPSTPVLPGSAAAIAPGATPAAGGVVEPATETAILQSGQIVLGAWIAGAPEDPARIDAYTGQVGVPPAVVQWFQSWGGDNPALTGFDSEAMDAVVARGAMPMVSWEPEGPGPRTTDQPEYALRTILAGEHDDYIRQWARDAAAWGWPFYLRFAHEMNGDWMPWSPGVNGNTSEEFVAAWRHVVDVFRQEGATNVRWVWSPNVLYGTTTYAEIYPGDDYVDWLGLSGYNWGTSQTWSSWQTLTAVFAESYAAIAQVSGKPIMLAEVASAEQGGDKAGWILQGLLTDLPLRFPQVKAVVWFDEYRPEQADWRVDSSPASLAAFRMVAASNLFQARLP